MADVKFFISSDIPLNVRVKLLSLIGIPPPLIYTSQSSPPEVFLTASLSADGKNIPLPITSNFHLFDSKKEWNEWLTFNIKYKDLPLSTQLVFTVWYSAGPGERRPLGGTSMSLFNHKRKLRKGRQRLILWQGREGDGSSTNPTPGKLAALEDINRVDRMRKQFDRNDRSQVKWLDDSVKEKVQRLCNELETDLLNKGLIFLLIELPSFEYPVVFREEGVRGADFGLVTAENSTSVYQIMPDPEMSVDVNPVENKHRIITYRRRRRRGLLDKDVQPNAAERKQIIKILRYPPSRQLPPEDRDFLWNFRTYLKNDKKALTKFLKCVNWTDEKDVQQAAELLNVWEPIDVADALELLSVTFKEPLVRKYAVSRIAIADDEELMCYLLQLVQALRYEANTEIGPLAEFLMERAIKSSDLGYFFFWFVTVECEDKRYREYYLKLRDRFERTLVERNYKDRFDMFAKQKQLVEKLTMLAKDVKNTRSGKAQRLREQAGNALKDVFPVYLPLYPAVCCTDIVSEKSNVFPSAMQPLKLIFRTKTEDYTIIYKNGDDLRQDQLVIQIFRLMDRLLKKENLDLKLIPYRVLATDLFNGMVEFVHQSLPVSAVISNGNNIKKFLEKCHPDPQGPFGIKAEVLETFVKSCAGYCVFTYILGVGDRHMDNLMLTEAGNLFHIDFGFILGNDPKAFPPPFKLSPQMVEAMGGVKSDYYYRFKSYCCEAYNILRKSASLIVNLFQLMRDAGIPQVDGDRSIKIIEDNLRLELTDEEAIKVFQQLIAESANALIPQVNDGLHSIASRWRSYWAR